MSCTSSSDFDMYIKTPIIQGFKSCTCAPSSTFICVWKMWCWKNYKFFFRSRPTQIVPFSPRHNVDVGRNGSGKSNFFAGELFISDLAWTTLANVQKKRFGLSCPTPIPLWRMRKGSPFYMKVFQCLLQYQLLVSSQSITMLLRGMNDFFFFQIISWNCVRQLKQSIPNWSWRGHIKANHWNEEVTNTD